MILELKRDGNPGLNFGKLFVDGLFFGETLEDPDRKLESGGVKIYGDTSIPRGRYRVTITYSQRFKKNMPYIHDVPEFSGVRIHGGNTEADTLGCPLLGQVRTTTGVAQCKGVNERLISAIESAILRGDDVWMEIS